MKKKDIPNTPEEKAHAAKRDALMKERPQEWEHIQRERQKIREQKTQEALQDVDYDNAPITFTQPTEGTMIGGMKSFHVEKGEERHTYQITTKREITFNYMIRAKNEEDEIEMCLAHAAMNYYESMSDSEVCPEYPGF